MRGLLGVVVLAAGCDDALIGVGEPAPTGPQSGWCGVQAVFVASCTGCHGAGSPAGGLDLQTDPYDALVNAPSAAWPYTLVVPGDPDASLLLRKVDGTTDATTGGPMPPTGPISADAVATIREWIADGADSACDTVPTGTGGAYHPEGWEDPAVHGLGAKLRSPGPGAGDDDCQSCHGEDLLGGGVGVACDSCHDPGWTTDCTFCHGDPEAVGSGDPPTWAAAPPEDIDDNDDPATITFPAHDLHLRSPLHADWDCGLCHVVPTDVFSPGHLFDGDETPGRADLTFGGLAVGASYTPGTCSEVYCHGNARAPGSVSTTAQVGCGDCHTLSWGSLSEPHDKHDEDGVDCAECHPTITPDGSGVDEPELHLDGAISLALPAGIAPDTSGAVTTCTGQCHGESHQGRRWQDD